MRDWAHFSNVVPRWMGIALTWLGSKKQKRKQILHNYKCTSTAKHLKSHATTVLLYGLPVEYFNICKIETLLSLLLKCARIQFPIDLCLVLSSRDCFYDEIQWSHLKLFLLASSSFQPSAPCTRVVIALSAFDHTSHWRAFRRAIFSNWSGSAISFERCLTPLDSCTKTYEVPYSFGMDGCVC